MIGWQDAAAGGAVAAAAAYLLWQGSKVFFGAAGGCGGCGSGCGKAKAGTGDVAAGSPAVTPAGEPLVSLGPFRPKRKDEAVAPSRAVSPASSTAAVDEPR